MIWRFFLWLLAVVWVLSISACMPTLAQPTATPILAPTITPDATQPLVLVLPGNSDQKTLVAANRHYSDAVKQKGWNVEFYTVNNSGDYGTDGFLSYIEKQLCSGIAQADGYVCSQTLSPDECKMLQEAKSNGQLYDCAAVAASVTPQYWAKFHDQISAAIFGLALADQSTPIDMSQPVLLVRDDMLPLTQQGMSGYNDLRSLSARLQKEHPANGFVQADPGQLLDLWCKQQGYMSLFANAGIYARIDDPDANTVLLEEIPGFEQFLRDTMEAQAQGMLLSGAMVSSPDGSVISSGADTRNVGPAVAVFDAVLLMYMNQTQNPLWSGYTAYLLHNDCSYASGWFEAYYADTVNQMETLQEMIIPARSRHATDAMEFIQWLYADRCNADAAIYGQEGIDYRLQGERVEMLDSATSDGQTPSWQNWSGRYLFQLAAEQRFSANAPKKTEELLRSLPSKPLAAPWLVCMSRTQAWSKLMNQETENVRHRVLSSFLDRGFSSDTSFDMQSFLKELRAAATDDVLRPYVDVLRETRIMAKQQ